MIDIDILCIGFACYDLVYIVDHQPGNDEKMFASSFIGCGGGPAANAAFAAARLGYKVAFVGYLGNDIYGEKHVDELRQQGVLTDLIVRGQDQTPLSCILVKPDGKRTIVNYRKKVKHLKPKSVDFDKFRFKTILFDGHESDIAIAFAKNAKEKNIPMILDAGSVHQGTNELIHLVDYLVSSAVFAKDFTKENDQEKALFELSCYASKVVITIGEQGCIWYNRPDYGRLPAFSVNVVDTTGCGDAFHGAFAAGVAAGMKWEEILKFSSAAGAICCTKKGGRLAMPTIKEVTDLIENNSLAML